MFEPDHLILPSLYPFHHLIKTEWSFAAREYLSHFSIVEHAAGDGLYAHESMCPYKWYTQRSLTAPGKTRYVVVEEHPTGTCAVGLDLQGSDLYVETNRYEAWQKGRRSVYGLTVSIPDMNGPAEVLWLYECQAAIGPHDQPQWTLLNWEKLTRKFSLLLKLLTCNPLPPPGLLVAERRAILKLVEAIVTGNEAFRPVLERLQARPVFDQDDFNAVRASVGAVLPAAYRDHLQSPRPVDQASWDEPKVIDLFAVRCKLESPTDELLRVDLLHRTMRGSGEVAKPGYAFLNEVLGYVPPAAKRPSQDTRATVLDVNVIPRRMSLQGQALAVVSPISCFAEAFLDSLPAIEKLFVEYDRQGWGHQGADLVPNEEI